MKVKWIIGFAILVALTAAGCFQQPASPTDTFKAFFEAVKNKDAAGAKKRLSKGSLSSIEADLKKRNKSFEEEIKEAKGFPEKMPETRGEKIEGARASVEYKDETRSDWYEMPFIKEDGEWKMESDREKRVRERD